jgi:hypothetical protein
MWTPDGLPALHFSITQLLYRYARGVDRRDWGLLRTLFHDDSLDDHGYTSGSLEEFIESFSERSSRVPEMTHVNGNVLILETDAERREALVETYCVAWSRVLPGELIPGSLYETPLLDRESPNARVLTVANRYLDLIGERDGQLRFVFRRVIFEWATVAEVQVANPFPEGGWTSSRNADDPSYRTLDDFRAEYLSRRA